MRQGLRVIDADTHQIEPATMWQDYIDPAFRDRAPRREEIGGRTLLAVEGESLTSEGKYPFSKPEFIAALARGFERFKRLREAGFAPKARLLDMDEQGVDVQVLYPTIGLLWECEVTDPELTVAYQRAYNRWIADFCRDTGGRLVPVAHLSLIDPEAAAAELERAVADGCRGAWVAPFAWTRKPHGHADHDPLWRKASELGVPMAIHPTFEPDWATPVRFQGLRRESPFFYNVMLRGMVSRILLSDPSYRPLSAPLDDIIAVEGIDAVVAA